MEKENKMLTDNDYTPPAPAPRPPPPAPPPPFRLSAYVVSSELLALAQKYSVLTKRTFTVNN